MAFNWSDFNQLSAASANLFNKNFLSDVQFKFPCGRVIYAHSLFLAIRGEEFYNTFKDNIGTGKVIDIQDDNYEYFHELLKCIYESKEIKLTQENCLEVLKLSKTNGIHDVQAKSENFIINNIELDNVLQTLEVGIEQNNLRIEKKSLAFVSINTNAVLGHPAFVEIKTPTLNAVLKLSHSISTEVNLFQAVMKWAANVNGQTQKGGSKRSILGDNLKLIRFPAMTTTEFKDCITAEPNLLTDNEISSILENIATKQTNKIGFSDYKRINYYSLSRIQINDRSTMKVALPAATRLSTKLTPSKSIELTAIGSYFPKCRETIRVLRSGDQQEIYCKSETIPYQKSWNDAMEPPVHLEANNEYEIIHSYEGLEGDEMLGYKNSHTLPFTVKGADGAEFLFRDISPNIEDFNYNVKD